MWGGVAHFIVSPMLFYIVYVGYSLSGSRYLMGRSGITTLILLLINLGFPMLRSFYMELPLMLTIFRVLMFCVNGMWFLKLRSGIVNVKLEYLSIFLVIIYIL